MTGDAEGHIVPQSRAQSIKRFIELVSEVSLEIRPRSLDAWSEIELTMHQFRTLSMLSHGPLRVSDVARGLGIRLPSATNLIGRMEGKYLLERIPDLEDRRVVWCRLTPLGRKEAENLWNINRRTLEVVATLLTDRELKATVHAFEILSSALHRRAEGEPPATSSP